MKTHRDRLLIGDSRVMAELREEIGQVADSDAKVLITGESGTGKELVAQSIHDASHRAERPFLAVNCAGLPETLLESELFGHVKGSFTGAYRDKPGKLEVADRGSVFLDEVGEMTLRMQGLLLRFLETGELQKVGAENSGGRVNVRVIAATNRDLREMIDQGNFREDLFYRLDVIHLDVPPLRDHRDDIPQLIGHFIANYATHNGNGHGVVPEIAPDAMDLLMAYHWPGNVRELENIIERLIVTGKTHNISADDLPPYIRLQRNANVGPRRERRHTVADELYKRLTHDHESFWSVVYPQYMQREITRTNVRELVRRGLEEAKGNYRIVAQMFNLDPSDYRRFLNFLRKHDCQLPFKEYRH